MSTDIKFSKAEMSKIVQACWFSGIMIGNLGKKALIDLVVFF